MSPIEEKLAEPAPGIGSPEDHIENETPRSILGLRRSALVEMGVFYSALLAVDLLVLDGSRYWDISPHPFWMIVALMACQYGANEGLASAFLSSVLLLSYNVPDQTLQQDVYGYLLSLASRPLMWSSTAILLGGLRDRHIQERADLRKQLAKSRLRESTIAKAFDRQKQSKNNLETRLAGQVNTATTLYKAASSIEKLNPEEVLRGVVDILRTLMDPEKFSVFLLRSDRLELNLETGWDESDPFQKEFRDSSPLFRRVIGERKLVSVVNEDDREILGEEGVLAGPMVDPDTEEIVGMLKVERMAFTDLSFTNIETFRVLSEWVASTYRNALKYQTAKSRSMYGQETQLYSFGFFLGQKDFFVDLAKRMGFRLSMLLVRLENADQLQAKERRVVSAALKQVVGTVLRKTDLAFDQRQTGQEFAIVLPGASVDDAGFVAKKVERGLREALGELGGKAQFSYLTQSLNKEDRSRVLLARELFEARLDFLLKLQGRVRFRLSMAALEIDNWASMDETLRSKVAGCFRRITSERLAEESDVGFAYQRSVSQITIVLPSADMKLAKSVAERILEHIHDEIGRDPVVFKSSIHRIAAPRNEDQTHASKAWRQAEKIFATS